MTTSLNVFTSWFHEAKFTTYNVVPTLDKKLTSQYVMNFVMVTSIWRWNCDVKFPMCSSYQYYNVAATLCQLCKERQIWITYDCMITIWLPCLKIAKKIINDMVFVWYAGSNSWHEIQATTFLSFPKSSQKLLSSGLEWWRIKSWSHSLKHREKTWSDLVFLSIFKAATIKKDVVQSQW